MRHGEPSPDLLHVISTSEILLATAVGLRKRSAAERMCDRVRSTEPERCAGTVSHQQCSSLGRELQYATQEEHRTESGDCA